MRRARPTRERTGGLGTGVERVSHCSETAIHSVLQNKHSHCIPCLRTNVPVPSIMTPVPGYKLVLCLSPSGTPGTYLVLTG